MWRLLKPILILPGTAVVAIPGLLLWGLGGPSHAPPWFLALPAALFAGIGIAFAVWTTRLFVREGRGTPAPWDPPRQLVVKGPYRHVRNPMITSVLLFLIGEALAFQSWPIAIWMALFAAANMIYFPLSEEPGLERRFGEPYRDYKANVPRWIPRLRPWTPPAADDDRAP